MPVDLNDTLAFLHVVYEGSFTAAARVLQQPKTTLSKRVRALEARLGMKLLHRTTRSLSLTEAGALYYEHCKNLISGLQDAESAVSQLQSGPRGWLRISTSYSLGFCLISTILAGFRAQYPEICLDIQASRSPLNLIEQKRDIALYLGALPESNLVVVQLGALPTGLYASPGYLARHGEPIHPDELVGHHILALSQARTAAGYAWPLSRLGGPAQHFPVAPVMVVSDLELLRQALYADEGITLATHASMEADTSSGRLKALLPDWSGPAQVVHALLPQSRVLAPKVRVFVDYARAHLRWERASQLEGSYALHTIQDPVLCLGPG